MNYKIGIMVIDYDLYIKNFSQIKSEIRKGNINVTAITNGWMTQSRIGLMDGFRYYDLEIFLKMPYDYLIVAAGKDDFLDVKEKMTGLFRGAKTVLPVEIFGILDFDFLGYIKLLNSKPSIISFNCWGGLTYSYLHMEFYSPTINTRFENEESYLKFISNLDHYLTTELIEAGTEYEEEIGEYPVGVLDDVQIKFVHYKEFKDAENKWNERKQRINRDNIICMLFTEKPEMAVLLDRTDKYRKIIFTAGDYGVKSQIDVSALCDMSKLTAAGCTFMAANGELHLYDVIGLLNGNEDYVQTCLR